MNKGHHLKRWTHRFAWALTCLIVLISPRLAPATEPPGVVATIKPLHSLVAAVMEGVGTPALLLEGDADPHHFALRPSQARLLEGARAVFWIGPALESPLARTLRANRPGRQVAAMMALPGMRHLPRDDGHGHGHEEEGLDAHIWLDVDNAQLMLREITRVLGGVFPAHVAKLEANARRMAQRLGELDAAIRASMAPLRGRDYVVYHNAYQYFERRHGLVHTGLVQVNEEVAPGPRQVSAIRRVLQGQGMRCLLRDPHTPPRMVHTLTEGMQVRVVEMDPAGLGLAPGPELYPRLLEGVAAGFARCLGD